MGWMQCFRIIHMFSCVLNVNELLKEFKSPVRETRLIYASVWMNKSADRKISHKLLNVLRTLVMCLHKIISVDASFDAS